MRISRINLVWIIAIVNCIVSLLWYIFGTTANFQRELDLISTINLFLLGTPAILLSIFCIFLIIREGKNEHISAYGKIFLIVCLVILSWLLYKNVDTRGWLTERVTSDTIKITEDGKYEYRLEIINLFQKNSYARLYIKQVEDNKVHKIRLDVKTSEIGGLSNARNDSEKHWVRMQQGEQSNMYFVYISKEISKYEEIYEIDVQSYAIIRKQIN